MTTASILITTSMEQAQCRSPGSSSRGVTPPTWALGEHHTMVGGRVIPAPPILEAREALVTGGRGPAPPMLEVRVRVTRLVSGEAGEVTSSLDMVTTLPPARARHPRLVGGDLMIME